MRTSMSYIYLSEDIQIERASGAKENFVVISA